MRLAFYTPAQAAVLKRCSVQAIHLAIKEGRLRAYHIGGGELIPRYLISPLELGFYEPRPYRKRKHWPKRRRQEWESEEEFAYRCAHPRPHRSRAELEERSHGAG
jgi:hypothetical protein